MRIIADASWLQALVGPLALITPVIGLSLGFTIYVLGDFSNSVIPTLLTCFAGAVLLGCF